MASVCISNSVNRAENQVRPTYRWPESDAVRLVWSNLSPAGTQDQPKVVDSISCRQMYLRSYKFSREESVPEKTRKCFRRVVGRRVFHRRKMKHDRRLRRRKSRFLVIRRAKDVSCAALFSFFRRLLFCTAKLDVRG
ncbi:hypothetical protein FNV43_RR04229 [Rhamnella rubrinervis]|uniref:Uncharacterized protein n=1 Tax=Rhamnella rubrinervis TaxID=2594499 RepID=A0A8K0MQ18_9ROSA|nr:hypothetical protein FNV43_RR04229 [Rhamnella rubrinervis]